MFLYVVGTKQGERSYGPFKTEADALEWAIETIHVDTEYEFIEPLRPAHPLTGAICACGNQMA